MRTASGEYSVRAAMPRDVHHLPDVERRAAARFRDLGLAFLADGPVTSEEVFAIACQEGRLWVAAKGDQPVGFALARSFPRTVHLQEMDVLPEHGRRGLGRRLVDAVLDWARGQGAERVTLTTFRDIPWNAPFYSRLGFLELVPESYSAELRGLLASEIAAGLIPELRLVMTHALGRAK